MILNRIQKVSHVDSRVWLKYKSTILVNIYFQNNSIIFPLFLLLDLYGFFSRMGGYLYFNIIRVKDMRPYSHNWQIGLYFLVYDYLYNLSLIQYSPSTKFGKYQTRGNTCIGVFIYIMQNYVLLYMYTHTKGNSTLFVLILLYYAIQVW